MNSTGIAASGMNTAALRLQVAAANVAGLGASDAMCQELVIASQTGGGAVATMVAAGADAMIQTIELIEGLAARNDFQANAVAFARADEALGTLLDVVA